MADPRRWRLAGLLLWVAAAACSGGDADDAPDATLAAIASGSVGAAEPVDSLAFLPADLAEHDRWIGDYPEMVERRAIRVLTVFGDGYYSLDGAQEFGFTYEMSRQLERWVNEREGSPRLPIRVVVLPVTLDRLVPLLQSGYGDIAAAGLTVTPEREAEVAFSRPFAEDVRELLVTGPESPAVETLADLGGRRVPVRPGSSYEASVARVSDSLVAAGHDAIRSVVVDRHIDDETLLRLVADGDLEWAVVDDFKARFWAEVLPELVLREDLVFRQGGEIAWAVRSDAPRLLEVLDGFVATHRQGTLIGNMLRKRYVESHAWLRRSGPGPLDPEFHPTAEVFRRYGERYGFDWRALVAQAYEESRLEQDLRSPRGAVGVMQLLPSTAQDLGIDRIDQLENNVHAGAAYMGFLRDQYFPEPALDSLNRYLFTLAAYNAGPGRIARLRGEAERDGLDPDQWFDNVEIAAARDIGRETVQYVNNVVRRYLSYLLIADQWGARQGR